MDPDTLVSKTVTAANGAIIVLAIFMVVFLLIQAFILNNAYTYGKELQKRCGVEYLEKETPNFQIHKAFIEKVEQNFHKIFYGFAGLFMVVTSLMTIIFIYILLKLGPENWQTMYTLFLGTGIPFLLILSILIIRKKPNPTIDTILLYVLLAPILFSQVISIENKIMFMVVNIVSILMLSAAISMVVVRSVKDFFSLNAGLLIYVAITLLLGFTKDKFIDGYRTQLWLQILLSIIISLPIFALFGFLLYIWGATLSGKINAQYKSVSPFAKPEVPIKETIYAHLVHLGSISGTLVLAYLYANNVLYLPDESHMRRIMKGCMIAIIVLILLMPFTSYFMYNIKVKNVKYSDHVDKINDNIKGILDNDTDPIVVNNLIRNIINSEGRNDPTFDPTDRINDPSFRLSDYIKHSENYVDIHSIVIPEDLRRYINPSFLRGDNLIYLKKALVEFYYECNQKSYGISSKDVASNYHINSFEEHQATFDKPLSKIAPFLMQNLRDILGEIPINQEQFPNKITQKQNLLDTLNRTVVHNKNTFDRTNVMPQEIYNQLRQLREDKTLENDTHSFYAIAKGIIYSGVILVSYIVFHTVYSKNPDFAGKAIAGALILLIIFICYVGFFTKDIWL
jgi:hypothetical protein